MQLIDRRFQVKHPLFDEKNQYFFVSGIVKTSSISIDTEVNSDKSFGFDFEVLKSLAAKLNMSIQKNDQGIVTYCGEKKISFAIELHKLKYDKDKNQFKLAIADDAITINRKDKKEKEILPVFIGDEKTGSLFLNE